MSQRTELRKKLNALQIKHNELADLYLASKAFEREVVEQIQLLQSKMDLMAFELEETGTTSSPEFMVDYSLKK